MNRIITLFFGLFLSSLLFAQQQKLKVDYDNDSRWFWGLNVGSTWSTTDVTKKHDWGWGLTIGKSFNYDYGKAISFDIRGRYLTGKWYGYDADTTGFQYANTALSTDPTNYNSAYGFSVLNYQTTLHEASLELVLHANNLRAKTGWDLFVFGGIGYTWYKTKGDLRDAGGNIYRYDTLDAYNRTNIDALLDGTFDTELDGTSGGAYSGAWMPSLGFGIGYQVGPRWSIGLEHKTTFTLDDNFDGYINPTGKRENDIYHYTSAYLRFHIRDHAKYVDPEDNTLENVNNYNPNTQANVPPIVDFRNPSVTGTTVSYPTYVIKADVKNVSSVNNVIFRQNGNYISNFSFNPSTQQFESTVTLNPGQNIFELTGTNTYGSDMEQTIIIYNREQQNPPVVNYVNPASSPTTVQNPVFNLSSTVFNVTQQSQVAMQLNGQPFTAFSFNPSNNTVTATLNLQVGTNIVTTTGTNQYGTDSESTTIIYNPQQTEQPPVVYYVDPNVNPYTTSQSTFTINADVLNIAGPQNITFKQNGSVNQNFVYNAATDDFQSSVVLNPGQNVFEIIATNTAGSAQATTIIIYERQAPKPPIVTITNPANNPQETSNAYYTLGATVLNVTQASQINVKLNGVNVPNFTYTQSTNGVTANLTLIEGANIITVTGTNNDGTDSKQTTIIYRKPVTVQPPVVTFSAPNTDPFTTEQPNYTVVASVLNVTAQSGVNVNVNGTNITNFTFNTANSTVTLPLTLIEGANVITITGTNTAGTDSEQQTIIYRKPVPVQPPVVSFIDPSVNPTTVFNQSYDVKARVRYVMNASQIALRINGQLSTNFAYSASSEIMTFTTGLVPGANIIEITATNSAGQDQESTTIIYRQPNPTIPPVVTITNPAANPHTVSTLTTPITATVLNVDGQQNIQVLVNGTPITGFVYNTSTKQLTFVMNLIQGSNSLMITATNTAGTANDSRTILYRKEQIVQPPFVTFISPAAPGTTVNTAGYTVKARVNNVEQASQVVVSQDGQIVSPNLWNFDVVSKEVTFNTNLNAGNNVFTVSGTNTAGTHSATTNIIYTIPVIVCDKPVVSFTAPASPGMQVENSSYNVVVSVLNVTSANQVKLLVNGALQSAGTFNGGTYTKTVTLAEGQNALEVLATNNCGETKAVTTIVYKPAAAPCNPPLVQRAEPMQQSLVIETETIGIKASVSNVTAVNQISLVVNGVSVPFNYDNAAHFVTANVNLVVGENTIAVVVSTPCGKAREEWKITRRKCDAPTISVTSATVPDGAMTIGESFALNASITGVTSSNAIVVTKNGTTIGSVFTPQTGILTFEHALPLGVSRFVIAVRNDCGESTLTYTVTRRADPNAVPPTIQITNPASTPFQTEQSGMTIQVVTTHVTAANQVAITVNGVPTNFSFNAANGSISFNTNFNAGSNVIVATAATQYGTATDSKTVIYRRPVTVQPPVITLKNPQRCPATFNPGIATIDGSVTNITDPGQVVIQFNGANVNFTSTITNGTLNFSFNLTIMPTTVNIPLVITATNAGGSDVKNCPISVSTTVNTQQGQGNGGVINGGNLNGNNGHGNNTDGNDESNPGQGNGGPTGTTGGSGDDENGNGNGNRGTNTTPIKTGTTTPVKKPMPVKP